MKTINNTPAQANANSNNATRMLSTVIGKFLTLVAILLTAVLPSNARNKVAEVWVENIKYSIYDDGTAGVNEIGINMSNFTLPANMQDLVEYKGRKYVVTIVETNIHCVTNDYALDHGIYNYFDSFKLPSKLVEIKESALIGLSTVKNGDHQQGVKSSMEFPASLKIIGPHAFERNGLDIINLPENLESLGEYAFYKSKLVSTVTFDNKLRRIPSFAFAESPKLASLTLGNNVEVIGNHAFAECPNLTSVTLGNNIEKIDNWAFKECKKIRQLNLPNSLKVIGIEAFAGIDSLRQVTLPAEIDSVKAAAFGSCPNLVLLTFSGNIPYFPRAAFDKNPGLLFMQVLSATPQELRKAIPGCESRILVVPDGAVEAYKNAEYWKKFKDIIPASDISFEGNNLTLKYNGFFYKRLKDQRSWTIEGSYERATDLNIPSELLGWPVTGIADFAFDGDSWIENIKLPETITSIGYKSFASLVNLHTLEMPANLQNVDWHAFDVCDINNLIINDAAFLESACFHDARIENVTFGENVSEIPNDSFWGQRLKSITFKGNKVKRIGDRAFYYNRLSKVEIPEGVISIGAHAFDGMNTIVEVSLPESLKEIGDWAFDFQNNIEIINCAGFPENVGSAPFSDNVMANATLRIHSNFEYWYKGDEYWGQFQNIELIEGESKVKGFSLGSDDDNVTGIEGTLVPERPVSSAAYNIAGQSANVNNVHGIVIKNGKKMMMR